MIVFFLTLAFGWCGFYRFYKRQYVRGVFYLLTFGFFCIGWAVDVLCALSEMIAELKNPAAVRAPQAAPRSGSMTKADELQQYKRLLDEGAITKEEYERKKGELLDDPALRFLVCEYCGTRNAKDAAMCSACGAKLL